MKQRLSVSACTHGAVKIAEAGGGHRHSVVQADAWYRQLLRSHEMMQQLVGGADPSSPLDADWDTASLTSTEQTEPADDKPVGWAAGHTMTPESC